MVSTHSRLKAAGAQVVMFVCAPSRFNTQPPEGGWFCVIIAHQKNGCFNTQPPEGGWPEGVLFPRIDPRFNTQPPEGGWAGREHLIQHLRVSTHSRLKAAGTDKGRRLLGVSVSTHSRLKAAGFPLAFCRLKKSRFNTQPPEGGWHIGDTTLGV